MTTFTVIIPARFASSRLPGKPLADIAGKPMIRHVWEKARQSGANRVVVATDNEQVKNAVLQFGLGKTQVRHGTFGGSGGKIRDRGR